MHWPSLALLIVVVALLVWRGVIRDRKEYARFRRLRSTLARQRTYRRWLIEAIVTFGGLSIVLLIGVWPVVPDVLADTREWAPAAWLIERIAPAVWLGIGVAFLVGLALPAIILRRTPDAEVPALGDVQALLPRTRAELPYGLGLSLNAGISEELLFRLALPALVFDLIGSGPLAFLVCALLFGALHAYQGPVGAVTATVLGLLLTALYVLTGSILVAIVVHALIDLRSLVLIPLALGRGRRPDSAPTVPDR